MKSLQIILVLNEAPLPFGHAVGRWYSVLLQGLIERGHRVIAYAACANPTEIELARVMFPALQYDFRPYPYPEKTSIRSKWQTLRRPFSYMIHPELQRDLGNELNRGFDILHLEGLWSGWLAGGVDPDKVVLNFHNLYSIDQPNFDNSWRSLLFGTLLRKSENRLLRSCKTLLTLTSRLKDTARLIAPQTPIHIVPLGLDTSRYPFIPPAHRPVRPTISVIGSMNWYPSYSAAIRLLTRLWAPIRMEIPDAQAVIVGWNARKALKHLLPIPGVEVIENVRDIQPFFERSSILLYAPERGSGMKVKVLEAFAYGVPVVTTEDGIEGIPAQDGIHVGLSGNDTGLVERTLGLLKNPGRQENYRRAARTLVEQCCHPHVALDAVERCYEDMLSRQRSQAA
jgi:glycosyltransferase involved in cell wall biosynthesis